LNFYERNSTKESCPLVAFDILNTYLFAAWKKKDEKNKKVLPVDDIIVILSYNWDNRLFDLVCDRNNWEKLWEVFCLHKNKNLLEDPVYAGICAKKILERILEKLKVEEFIEKYELLVPALNHSYLFSFGRLQKVLKKFNSKWSSLSKENDKPPTAVFSFLNKFFAHLNIEKPDPFYFRCLMKAVSLDQLFSIFWHYLKITPPDGEKEAYDHSCHWLANCVVLTGSNLEEKIPFSLKWQLLTFYYEKYRRMPSAENFFADIEKEKKMTFIQAVPIFFPFRKARVWQQQMEAELKDLFNNNHQPLLVLCPQKKV
jgi:hypothetical protein